MKYLALLFLSLSLNTFAQTEKQILLQTSPTEKYNITYTAGEYTFCFSYQDFMDNLRHLYFSKEEKLSLQAYIDSKLASQPTFELVSGHIIQKDNEKQDLKELIERRVIYKLICSGNFILLDASGRPAVQAINRSFPKNDNWAVFTNADTGKEIYRYEGYFRTTGTPSF